MRRRPFFSPATGALLRTHSASSVVSSSSVPALPSFATLLSVSAELIAEHVRNASEAHVLRELGEAGSRLDTLLAELLTAFRRFQVLGRWGLTLTTSGMRTRPPLSHLRRWDSLTLTSLLLCLLL
mmetsp:Transcript_29059/g.73036  ORF Transcript_29059/g.73036 Transcript_29059/m.73036 type:complete len:125 (+) Transcript_29059:24-398(+)